MAAPTPSVLDSKSVLFTALESSGRSFLPSPRQHTRSVDPEDNSKFLKNRFRKESGTYSREPEEPLEEGRLAEKVRMKLAKLVPYQDDKRRMNLLKLQMDQ